MLRDDLARGPRVKKVPEHFEPSGTFKVDFVQGPAGLKTAGCWEGAESVQRLGDEVVRSSGGVRGSIGAEMPAASFLYCSMQVLTHKKDSYAARLCTNTDHATHAKIIILPTDSRIMRSSASRENSQQTGQVARSHPALGGDSASLRSYE